jgi:hypothetical protein
MCLTTLDFDFEVRKEERKHSDMPKALRWAVLKNVESPMTDKKAQALL